MSSFLLFLTINYLNLSVSTLQFFNCIDLNGWYVMALAPDIPCDGPPESMHQQLKPFAAASLILYPIGILLMFAYVIFSNRDVIKQAALIRLQNDTVDFDDDDEDDFERLYKLDKLWGFSYSGCDASFYYWEIVRFSRKLIMALLTMMKEPLDMCFTGTLVYMVSFVATLYAHPNSSERIDVLETVQHISILMLMIGGFVLGSGMLTEAGNEHIGRILVASIYTAMCTIICFVISDIKIFDDDDAPLDAEVQIKRSGSSRFEDDDASDDGASSMKSGGSGADGSKKRLGLVA